MAKRAHSGKSPMKKEPKEFDEEVVEIARVTKVVKGGRRLRFRATVVIGNRKGKVGMGIGKSHEVTGAIQKAIAKAKKDLVTVNLDGSTIPHDVKIKEKSSIILLLPAAPGTGIIAGGTIRKVLELAGVKDILSKSFGTTNKVNNTKATFKALKKMRRTPLMELKAKKKEKESAKKPENSEKKAEKPAVKKPAAKKEKPAVKKPADKPAGKPAEKSANQDQDKE